MKEIEIVICLILVFTIRGAQNAKPGITLIDQTRNKLLEHEKILEKDLFNPRFDAFEGHEEGKYLHLIKSYKTFGNELEEKFPSSGYEYLSPLSSVWLWARTENELREIDGLYNVFRQMQLEIIDKKAYLDLQKLADFSETILHDPNASMLRALARIADFIVHDKLFVSSYQVQCSIVANIL